MKIAFIDPSLFTWPYDHELAAAFRGLGHDARIFGKVLPADDPRMSEPVFEPMFYAALAGGKPPAIAAKLLKGLAHASSMRRLVRTLAEWRPDVIHFQWLPLPVIDQRFLRPLRRIAPLVLTVHDTTPFNGTPSLWLQGLGAHAAWRAFDGLIVHTEQGVRRLREQGMPPNRISRIPHGLLHGAQAQPPAMADEPAVKPSTDQPADAPVDFLLFGKIRPYKGVDVVLRALGRMPTDIRARCRVRVVGQPYVDTDSLRRLAAEQGVTGSVTFDFRFVPDDEMSRLLGEADALLFPYREIEASGVLMAAIAHGRPMIASRLGAFGELIRDGENGLLTPPADDVALAEAMTRFIAEPALRARTTMGIAELRDSIPSWTEIARRTRTLYESLNCRQSVVRPLQAASAA